MTDILILIAILLVLAAVIADIVLTVRTRKDDGVAPALQDFLLKRFSEQRGELSDGLRTARAEQASSIDALGSRMDGQMARMLESVSAGLSRIREGNESQLEKIRGTVDEKLQKTLDERLAASFGEVSTQLQAVSRGLGEMRGLADDTRDLKRALTNVKARGTYGEVRCEKLLSDILAPSQYEANVNIQGNNVVEFAVKLPGRDGEPVLLPIDSKFPIEDYNRLLDAEDKAAIESARKALRTRVLGCAKDIRDKYILPPKTTDFAVMFLPTEGLYAEVIRDAALFEELRTKYSVTPVGVATLSAFLSSLQAGFRTLAIDARARDVQSALEAVKTEMGKFGDLLAKAQKQVQQADATLGALSGTRLTAINRKLRAFDAAPEEDAGRLLGIGQDGP